MIRQKNIKHIRTGCFLCLLFFQLTSTYSQTTQSKNPVFLSITPYYGKFQVHTRSLRPFKNTNPYGVEFEMSRLILTEKIRETFGTFVKWGTCFNYVNFNHKDLGYALTGLAHIEPFFKLNSEWRISVKLGTGLAYMSNPYHPTDNPQNLTYSSRIAFPLYVGANTYYFFNKQTAVKINLSYQHISNGGFKQPNLGINYPVIGLGLEHALDTYSIPPKKALGQYEKERCVGLLMGYSIKEDTTNTNNQHVATAMLFYSRQVTRINSITGAISTEYQQIAQSSNALDEWSIAPMIGNELIFGKLLFGQQIGAYILRGESAPNALLQNYYLLYKINSNLRTGVNLKVHGRVADYLSFQFGLVF